MKIVTKNKKLIKAVSRDWSLVTIELWNENFKTEMKKKIGWSFNEAVMINDKGLVSFYRIEEEQRNYKLFVLNKIKKDWNWLQCLYEDFKPRVQKLKKKLKKYSKESFYININKDSSENIYRIFKVFRRDFLNILPVYLLFAWLWLWEEEGALKQLKNRKEILDIMRKGRLIAEGIYDPVDGIILNFIDIISRKHKIKKELLKYATIKEINNILLKGEMPNLKNLKDRKRRYILISNRIIIGEEPNIILKKRGFVVYEGKDGNVDVINGQIAYSGKVQGVVRVILTKNKINSIRNKEILVTTMTTPDFLPAMRKATAFITDEGGILCHAAIVSREFKKPCIIGTKIATKVLKDGDLVEVDANKGVVKILKRAE